MSLDQLALNNLTILSKFKSEKQFLSITNKNKLNINDKEEEYESITTLSDLEYPIHFSFHHTFTMLNNNNVHNSPSITFQNSNEENQEDVKVITI